VRREGSGEREREKGRGSGEEREKKKEEEEEEEKRKSTALFFSESNKLFQKFILKNKWAGIATRASKKNTEKGPVLPAVSTDLQPQ
jgi:hypothetical protein